MKFFTMEWWLGHADVEYVEDLRSAITKYETYLKEVRQSLPPSVLQIAEPASLHDANVVELSCDMSNRSALLALNGDDGCGNLLRIELNYEGVSSLSSKSLDKCHELPRLGFGDLGYHEIEVLAPETFEQRILFSSGIEVSIVFNKLRLSPNFRDQSLSG